MAKISWWWYVGKFAYSLYLATKALQEKFKYDTRASNLCLMTSSAVQLVSWAQPGISETIGQPQFIFGKNKAAAWNNFRVVDIAWLVRPRGTAGRCGSALPVPVPCYWAAWVLVLVSLPWPTILVTPLTMLSPHVCTLQWRPSFYVVHLFDIQTH